MHPNSTFHNRETAQNLDFARSRAFGVLGVNGASGPLLAHVPFLLSADGKTAELHLVRSNPIARALDVPMPAVLSVSGADGYVSPDWYGIEDQVPTWNYVAVHLRGTLEARPAEELGDLLARQSASYEARLAPKPAWTMDKLTVETQHKLMRMIVPCRIGIAEVDGTWKLSQNKPGSARLAAADALAHNDFGTGIGELAGLMRAQ